MITDLLGQKIYYHTKGFFMVWKWEKDRLGDLNNEGISFPKIISGDRSVLTDHFGFALLCLTGKRWQHFQLLKLIIMPCVKDDCVVKSTSIQSCADANLTIM